MVPRYSRKEMVDIWSDDSKYSIWLDIEVYALEGMELMKIMVILMVESGRFIINLAQIILILIEIVDMALM